MDDLISRQAAIDAIKEKMFRRLAGGFYGAMQVLEELSPAERPKGEWIDKGVYAECSNCGADMRGEQDDKCRQV